MSSIFSKSYRFALPGMMIFLASGLALAQDQPPTAPPPSQPPQNGTWRHMNDQPPAAQQQTAPQQTVPQQGQNPEPVDRSGQPAPSAPQGSAPPSYGVPAQLTIKPNTYINIRINQTLSSDKSHVGDSFSATLMQPVIVDGIVVAPRGGMVYGRVVDAEKAHDGKDSRLGVELNSITLVDGTQASITTRLVSMHGPTTPRGVEAGTVIGTTATGAAIGGIAARGTGAAIGAGAGAAAGLAAVMLTHNHPTVVYPESALTFAVTDAVAINTTNSAQAFRYVGPEDYYGSNRPAQPQQRPGYVYGPGYPAPAPYPYYYPAYPYPYWGPSIGIGFGWGFGPRFGYGRRW
jgi:hypothetical protein